MTLSLLSSLRAVSQSSLPGQDDSHGLANCLLSTPLPLLLTLLTAEWVHPLESHLRPVCQILPHYWECHILLEHYSCIHSPCLSIPFDIKESTHSWGWESVRLLFSMLACLWVSSIVQVLLRQPCRWDFMCIDSQHFQKLWFHIKCPVSLALTVFLSLLLQWSPSLRHKSYTVDGLHIIWDCIFG